MSNSAHFAHDRRLPVDDAIITGELDRRPSRSPDHEGEARALRDLADIMAREPDALLQSLAGAAMALTRSGSAGISLLEADGAHGAYRWVAASGAFARHQGKTLPLDANPSSEAVARNAVLLLREPGRVFPPSFEVEADVHEALLAPFQVDGRPAGTVWAVKHHPGDRFEREDARLLESLARFAAAAHGVMQALHAAEAAGRRSEAELAARLADAELLQRLSTSLIPEQEPGALYEQSLTAAMSLMRADAASLQVLTPTRDQLILLAARNLHPQSISHWHLVDAGNASLCGQSLRAHARVVVEDIETEASLAGTPDLVEFRRCGIRAAQSTPLVARSGRPIGLISTHWRTPRRLQAADFRLLDVLARQLADLLERADAAAMVRGSEERQALLLRISDAVRTASNAAYIEQTAMRLLGEHLGLARAYYFSVERDAHGWLHIIESAYQREPGQPNMAGRHTLKHFGTWLFEGFERGEAIVVPDVSAVTALTADEAARYRAIGVVAFVNVPFLRHGEYSAGIGAHDTVSRAWTPAEIALIREVGERTWMAVERARAEAALRESEARFRTLSDTVPAMIWQNDADGQNLFANQYLLDYTGKPASAINGLQWHALIHPDQVASYIASYMVAVRDRSAWHSRSRILRHDGAWRWFDNHARPLLDQHGTYLGHVGASTDIDDSVQAEAALRENEEALAADLANAELLRGLAERLVTEENVRTIYDEILSAAIVVVGSDAGSVQIYDAETQSLELLTAQNFSPRIAERFRSVDSSSRTACGIALKTGQRAFADFTDDTADAGCLLLVDAGFRSALAIPLVSRTGKQLGMLNTHWRAAGHRSTERQLRFLELIARQAADLIEQRQAQSVLRESEERLRQFGDASLDILWIRDAETLQWTYLTPAFEAIYGLSREEALTGDNYRGWQDMILPEDRARAGIPQLVWRSDAAGRWTWCSPQWMSFTGQAQADSHDSGWRAVVHPDDHAAATRAWDAAQPHGTLDVEFRVRRASDGAWLWHRTRSVPVRDASGPDGVEGRILEWLGTTTDIDDLKHLQDGQHVLVAELQHRTRNLLGVVRNVARRSIAASPERDEYDARLAALGRVQGFLSRSPGYAVPLGDVVAAELQAAGDGASEQVATSGPAVDLPGESVQVVALALHELATNAVKYGALAQPSGRLSVTWHIAAADDATPRLVIDWRESQVAMPDGPPERRGYGTELITRALPYQLQAETALEFTHDGVRCRITLPASAFTDQTKERSHHGNGFEAPGHAAGPPRAGGGG